MPKKSTEVDNMREEYDFSKAEIGKYAVSFPKGSRVILLDPDVAKIFKTQEMANAALRGLAETMKLVKR